MYTASTSRKNSYYKLCNLRSNRSEKYCTLNATCLQMTIDSTIYSPSSALCLDNYLTLDNLLESFLFILEAGLLRSEYAYFLTNFFKRRLYLSKTAFLSYWRHWAVSSGHGLWNMRQTFEIYVHHITAFIIQSLLFPHNITQHDPDFKFGSEIIVLIIKINYKINLCMHESQPYLTSSFSVE